MSVAERASSEQAELLLTELEVALARGTETYLLPLGIAWEDKISDALPQQLALARVRRGRRVGFLTDAFAIDALPLVVLRALADKSVLPLAKGEIRFMPTARLSEIQFPPAPDIRRLSAEQSNSSLIVGDQAVLKLVRRLSAGIPPQAQMNPYLTGRGLAHTPPTLGGGARFRPDGTPHTRGLGRGAARTHGG